MPNSSFLFFVLMSLDGSGVELHSRSYHFDFITTICRLCAPQEYERNGKETIAQCIDDHESSIIADIAIERLIVRVAEYSCKRIVLKKILLW